MTLQAEAIAEIAARIPTVRRMTGRFVRMDGLLAVVEVGPGVYARARCVGWSTFIPGMVLQLQHDAGQLIATGPAKPLNPIGTVKVAGTPISTVTVDGVDYPMSRLATYTPRPGDVVVLDWSSATINGLRTTSPEPPPPVPPEGGGAEPLDLTVQAASSGNYWRGGGIWNSTDPRASTNNTGAWFYGSKISDSLVGAALSGASVFLPAARQPGTVLLGLHPHLTQPGGQPTVSSATAIPSATGWVPLPSGFAAALQSGAARGLTVQSSNGDNLWRGVPADPLSGAIRFTGTR